MDKKNAAMLALALIVGLLVGCFATYGVLQYSMKIGNTATLKLVGIGVFTNANLTTPVTSINWGMLEPGQAENYSAYLLSESNVPITLSMYTANWNPSNVRLPDSHVELRSPNNRAATILFGLWLPPLLI